MSRTVYQNGIAGFWDRETGAFVPYRNQYGNRGGGGGGNYNRNYSGGGSNFQRGGGSQRPQKKHSGAKTGINKAGSQKGKPHIVAWNYSRQRGMISLVATPYKDTDKHKSASGRVWENWMVSWKNKTTFQEGVTSGLYDTTTGKLIIKEWGWVVNPKAPNGGYCGKFSRK